MGVHIRIHCDVCVVYSVTLKLCSIHIYQVKKCFLFSFFFTVLTIYKNNNENKNNNKAKNTTFVI